MSFSKIRDNQHYIRNTHDVAYMIDNNKLCNKLTNMIDEFDINGHYIHKKVLLLNSIKFELVMRQIKEPLCSRRLFVKKRTPIFNMSTKNITFKFK